MNYGARDKSGASLRKVIHSFRGEMMIFLLAYVSFNLPDISFRTFDLEIGKENLLNEFVLGRNF